MTKQRSVSNGKAAPTAVAAASTTSLAPPPLASSSLTRDVGDTDLISVVKKIAGGEGSIEELKRVLEDRPSIANLANVRGVTPLMVICSAPNPPTQSNANKGGSSGARSEAVQLLVECGANPYLTNSSGLNSFDCAPEGAIREEVVAAVLAHRLQHEPKVKSIAPLSASRLMKRAADDTGTGVFSNVAKHCLYFSYKGGIFMWDVVKDIEHSIYQPRDHHASYSALDGELGQFERKRSFVAHGGMDSTYDPSKGEDLAKKLKSLEQQIPLVTNFAVVSGLESQRTPIPQRGVSEWILCNTGALLEVRVDEHGVKLRQGRGAAGGRRKSQVCGGTADYPDGMTPHVNVHPAGGVRFAKRLDAGQVCCAADGTFGTIAYVVAAKSPPIPRLHQPTSHTPQHRGFNATVVADRDCLSPISPSDSVRGRSPIDDSVTFRDAFSDTAAASHRGESPAVGFGGGEPMGRAARAAGRFTAVSTQDGDSDRSVSPSTTVAVTTDSTKAGQTSVNVLPSDGIVFRVLQFRHMSPKDGFDHCMKSLASKFDPYEECEVSELRGPQLEGSGDALMVLQCRREFFILVTQKKIFGADVNPKRRHSSSANSFRAEFFEFQNMSCDGSSTSQFTHATALAPQRFTQIKSTTQSFFLVTVSTDALTMFEVHEDRQTVPVFKMYPDRVQPHRFTPIFHPVENSLLIFYQSLTRQEVCTLDTVTFKMQSVCKLPRPSSLRFYSQPSADDAKQRRKQKRLGIPTEPEPEVPQSNFALSTDGAHLLRYNVTMHVMSIYSWDEIRARSEVPGTYVNVSLVREPLPPPPDPFEAARMVAKSREPLLRGSNCVWIVAESLDLQRYQSNRNMTRDSTSDGSEDGGDVTRALSDQVIQDAVFADKFASQTKEVFQRVAASFGAKFVPYQPQPFSFTPSPEDDYDEEELKRMEAEYLGAMPRHAGIWAASIVSPLEAVQCAIKMIREYLRAPWDADILAAEPSYAPRKMEYQPKTAIEKRFPSVPDPEASTWLSRGPRLRYYICSAETTSFVHVLHEQINPLVTTDVDGVIIIDPKLRRVLRPLIPFICREPVPTVEMGAALLTVPPELSSWL
jgi:hypothetical protein